MLITKTAISILQTTFSMLYGAAWSETPNWYQNIATVIPSSTKTNTYGWMQRILQMREWVGPRLFQNLNTHSFVVENKDWELTVKVPRNDFADDNLGIWSPLMSEMGRQGKKLPDILVQGALQAGSAAASLGFDGLPFFSALHTLNPAGVQSNLFTAATSGATPLVAGAGVGLDKVRQAMISYTGEDGLPMGVYPNLLIVPPQLEFAAKTILFAERAANGSTNIQKGDMNYIVIPELANAPTEWFVADTTKSIKPLIYQLREAVKMTSLTNVDDANVFFHKEFVWGQDGRAVASYGPWFLMAKAI